MSRLWLAAAAVCTVTIATSTQAQERAGYPHWGLQASIGEDVDLGLGVRYENRMLGMFPQSPNLRFDLTFDYFFPDNFDYWEINANVFNLFQGRGSRVVPYLGGGLNIARASAGGARNTDAGLNLLGGLRLPGRYRPFLEARIELGGGDRLVVTGGWLFW